MFHFFHSWTQWIHHDFVNVKEISGKIVQRDEVLVRTCRTCGLKSYKRLLVAEV